MAKQDDFKGVPFLGTFVLFIRASMRSIWSIAILWTDLQVFSGEWTLLEGSQIESTFWIVNLLVLGFWFGERAVSAIMPLYLAKTGK